MHLGEFQELMRRTYLDRDAARGVDGTFRRLVEEVGEVARALRHEDDRARDEELADGCPKCGRIPCGCPGS